MPFFIIQKMENFAKRWSELEKKILNGPDEDLIANHNNALSGVAGRNIMLDSNPMKPRESITSSTLTSVSIQQDDTTSHSNDANRKQDQCSSSKESISSKIVETTVNNESSINNTTVIENKKITSTTAQHMVTMDSSISESDALDEAERLIRLAKNKSEKLHEFKKTQSIDSIKNKTIVTPIDLEPTANDDQETHDLRSQVNIIKLEELNDHLESNGKSSLARVNDELVATSYTNGHKIVKSDSLDAASLKYKIQDGTDSKTESISVKLYENDDIKLILNDLFDWLLWINHTLDSQVVVLGDLDEIQQSIQKFNSILNEINNKQEQLEKLVERINKKDEEHEDTISDRNKLNTLNSQWSDCLKKLNDRKSQLETMQIECSKLDQINNEFSNRINEMENKVQSLPDIVRFGQDTLKRQKSQYKQIKSELNQTRHLFDELKEINEKIMNKYSNDDTSKIKIKYDRMVSRFNELVNRLMNRGDNITEALQTIDDFDGILQDFLQWLHKIEQDLNYLEDYCLKSDDTNSTKQTVIELYQELQKEIDNQNIKYSNLTETSAKILESLKKKEQKENLESNLNDINKRWLQLRKKSLEIRSRLESNSHQWSALLSSLKELIQWCKLQRKDILIKKQNLQPDLNYICKQINENKAFISNIEYKKPIIESTLASAKLYFDDRIKKNSSENFSNNSGSLKSNNNNNINSSNVTNNLTDINNCKNTNNNSKINFSLSSKKKGKNINELENNEIIPNNYDILNDADLLLNNDNDDFDEIDIDDEESYNNNNSSSIDQQETILSSANLIKKIDKKVQLLDRVWQELNRNSLNYNNLLYNFYQNLQNLHNSFELVTQKLNENEHIIAKLNTNNTLSEIDSDKLAEEFEKVKNFQLRLSSYQSLIDDMCTQFTNINQELQSCYSVSNNESQVQVVSEAQQTLNTKFDDLNLRWTNLQSQLQEKYLHMYSLIESCGADIFLKLSDSVQPPWQRSISSNNKVPYYINHASEITSWDHPKMIELCKSFTNFNDIRFSAYRTAMKLRALQKRLWLDFVELNDVIEAFNKHGLKDQNERNIDTVQIIQCLNKLFQPAIKQNPQIDLVLAIDLTLNWLLSVYDPSKCGQIRVLSMKISIVLLSKGSIEDKYIYLFSLISDSNGLCNNRKLGLLLYDMIMIPKQLGEVAAFGGSNVEPSVRSCFEYAKSPSEINLNNFLEWVKLEPQSIVWLPVLHRLAAAETARHDSKCSICKEYPIVGFRYRSLKHFNFDICQNCFFSGRKIKGFKFDHPLLEYYTPTSSSDDIKDFFRIFRNKFRSKRARRSSKLGYLPVQSVLEGDELNGNQCDYANSVDYRSQDEMELVNKEPNTNGHYSQSLLNKQRNNLSPEISKQPKIDPHFVTTAYDSSKITFNLNNNKSTEKQINKSSPKMTKSMNGSNKITNANDDDEHLLIAKLCNTLSDESNKSDTKTMKDNYEPVQSQKHSSKFKSELVQKLNQQNELEDIIQDLEEENVLLMEEYTRLKKQINTQQPSSSQSLSTQNLNDNSIIRMKSFTLQNTNSSSHRNGRHQQYTTQLLTSKYKSTCKSSSSRALSSSPVSQSHNSIAFGVGHNTTSNSTNNYITNANLLNSTSMINNLPGQQSSNNNTYGKFPSLFKPLNRSVNMLYTNNSLNNKEAQMINEARMLRQHEDRLEARMKILENHNRLLDSQLKQLKSLLNKSKEAETRIPLSPSHNLSSLDLKLDRLSNNNTSTLSSNNNIGALFHNVEDITRAINNLNNLVNTFGN